MAVDLIGGPVTFEATALGSIAGGADGYTAVGAGNDTLDVVAGSELVGVNSITWVHVAGSDSATTALSRTLAAARASGARFRHSWWCKVKTGAGSDPTYLSLTDAAFDPTTYATCGIRVAVRENGTDMEVMVNDNANTDAADPTALTPLLDLGVATLFVIDVNTDDTYELWADQGAGKISLRSGTLIAGNVLLAREVFWQAANTVPSSRFYFDQSCTVTPRADTKAVLRSHRSYFGEITAATVVGDTLSITTTIYDAETTLALWTYDDVLPKSAASGEAKDKGLEQLDAAVAKALALYGAQANAAGIIGHELEL